MSALGQKLTSRMRGRGPLSAISRSEGSLPVRAIDRRKRSPQRVG